jgi:hypothetical protein
MPHGAAAWPNYSHIITSLENNHWPSLEDFFSRMQACCENSETWRQTVFILSQHTSLCVAILSGQHEAALASAADIFAMANFGSAIKIEDCQNVT